MPETLLLVGKIAFLLLLYLFIFGVVRTSARDLRLAAPVVAGKHWRMPGATPQEEEESAGAGVATATMEGGVWTLAVLKSPSIPEMDICLDDTFVSTKHALFEVTDEGFWVEDLRSTNGTQVNGAPIHESTLLEVGDQVAVGDTVFEVRVR
jgi:hypothetical protein